jgi:hypothetical protein
MKKRVLILLWGMLVLADSFGQSTDGLVARITASGPLEFCPGDSVVLSTPAGTDFRYQWKRNDADILNATRRTLTVRQSGIYSVVVTRGTSFAADNAQVRVIELTTSFVPGFLLEFCTGSSTTLTVTGNGGRAPYTHEWKQGATAVGNGNAHTFRTGGEYTVTTTDAGGCAAQPVGFTLKENPKPTATAGPDVVVTGNERYTVTGAATTGSLVYWTTDPPVPIENTVTLTPTLGPFTANTTLILTVNAGGECGAVARAQVVYRPCGFEARLLGKGTICRGEADTLGVQLTGGTGEYAYLWQKDDALVSEEPRYAATEPGAYSVVITDSKGCTATVGPLAITERTRPTVGISGEAAFCKGSTTVLTATPSAGTGPYTFQWKLGANAAGTTNPLTVGTAGAYVVTVTDSAGCTATSAARGVSEKGGDLTALIVPLGPTSAYGPVTLNANAGLNYTYQWRKNGQDLAGATAISYVVREPGEGSYTVAVSRDGCTVTSAPVPVSVLVPTGLEPTLQFTVYPNPVGNVLRVDLALETPTPLTLRLTDTGGRLLRSEHRPQAAQRHTVEFNLTGFAHGLYLLEARTASGHVVRKVLKSD